jgi:hypothetical protein
MGMEGPALGKGKSPMHLLGEQQLARGGGRILYALLTAPLGTRRQQQRPCTWPHRLAPILRRLGTFRFGGGGGGGGRGGVSGGVVGGGVGGGELRDVTQAEHVTQIVGELLVG